MKAEPSGALDLEFLGQIGAHVRLPAWSIKQKLALACRTLAAEGHESGLAGQISARAETPGSFWTLRFGLGLDEATEDVFIRVGEELDTLEGDGIPNPATRFHSWIYRTRADVTCIIHTHPPHISALSMVGEPLAIAHMDATLFFDDCAYLKHWPGMPVADEEGQIICAALGAKRAILLAHHGQVIAGSSIEEAAVLAIMIERVARTQLLARSVGPIAPIKPELARAARDLLRKPSIMSSMFFYFARRALRDAPDCINHA
jgi:L-fuculose-phosphate aldolase